MNKNIMVLLILILICNELSSQFKASNYVPVGSIELLDSNRLINKTTSHLRLIRNEIFANHGYIFNTIEMRNHFSHCQWYEPKYEDVDHLLTELEKKNIEFITSLEKTGFINISEINQFNRLESNSYFIFDVNKFSSRNVNYRNLTLNKKDGLQDRFIIQKIVDYNINESLTVDDPSIQFITLNIFKLSNNNLTFYKRIKTDDDQIEIIEIEGKLALRSTKFISGEKIIKLVDVEDEYPITLCNDPNQCFELKADNTRWISYFSFPGFDWTYEIQKNFIRIDNVRHQKIGTIMYSDFDNVYTMIDLFVPYNLINKNRNYFKASIELVSINNNEKLPKTYLRNRMLIDEFKGFYIALKHISGEYVFNVLGDNIEMNQASKQDSNVVKIRKREFK